MNFQRQSWFSALWETTAAIAASVAQGTSSNGPPWKCAARFYRWRFGKWYCEGCQRRHSGRVVRYTVFGLDFCYRAAKWAALDAAAECEKPLEKMGCAFDGVHNGRQDITQDVQDAIRKGKFWR